MGSPSPRDTGVSSGGAEPARVCTTGFAQARACALGCARHHATCLDGGTAGDSPVELVSPVGMLLNMFTTLHGVCPCDEVPWEGAGVGGRRKELCFQPI